MTNAWLDTKIANVKVYKVHTDTTLTNCMEKYVERSTDRVIDNQVN